MKYKEIITVLFFVLSSLTAFIVFPVENVFQKSIVMIIFFILIPLIFNKFILKKPLFFFGLQLGDWRWGIKLSLMAFLCVGIILFISSSYLGFFEKYSAPIFIAEKFSNFILYEFFVVAFFVFIYEFYFRGLVIFVLAAKLKYWTILIQTVIFLWLFLSMNEALRYTFLPYLIFAPFAGLIAYKSKSIIYSGVTQFLIIFFLDVLFVKMLK